MRERAHFRDQEFECANAAGGPPNMHSFSRLLLLMPLAAGAFQRPRRAHQTNCFSIMLDSYGNHHARPLFIKIYNENDAGI